MSNLSLSFELISFINWLLENKKTLLSQLIVQSFKNDIHKLNHDSNKGQNGAWAHKVIKTFIDFLEKTLKKSLEKDDLLEARLREELSELASTVDFSGFDDQAIVKGFRQAKNQIKTNHVQVSEKALLQQVLMQGILENWKPTTFSAEA